MLQTISKDGMPISIPRKFLVGVDGSEGSDRAVDFTLALAEKLGASVVFVHTVTLGDQGKAILEKSESKANGKHIPCKSFLEVGETTKEVLRISTEENCDCIVIGKKGQPKIEGALMSTNTDKIVMLSKVPVICV